VYNGCASERVMMMVVVDARREWRRFTGSLVGVWCAQRPIRRFGRLSRFGLAAQCVIRAEHLFTIQ
jgi:hypothetical protein